MNLTAWFFRFANSKLITVRATVPHKLLKLGYGFSKWMVRSIILKNPVATRKIVTIQNFDGDIKLKIDRSRTIGASLFWTGFHEFRELLFLHDFLQPGMVMLDVGANIGEYTVFAAKRMASGRVLAFEPLPSIRKDLEENIRLNHFENITVLPYGLSDQPGQFPIFMVGESENEGQATFFSDSSSNQNSIVADLKVLDAEWKSFELTRLDFIKMDIEGSELMALRGSINTIRQFRPLVLLEISEVTYQAAGYTKKEISDYFQQLNYLPFECNKLGKLQRCTSLPTFGNIIFVPQ
jgi:FkbM family methyltransferase